ncbi:MAG: hypothetical protein JSS50_02530 [Proteobacteria bacterium]|nr:hypothetical protein [Pseudomonadota bacterium]
MQQAHILSQSAFIDKSATRWYDNPDLSDLLFSTFNNNEFRQHTICLNTYKAGVGGFQNFQLVEDDRFQADFVPAIEKPLEGKVAYYSILTVSTTDPAEIKSKFDAILDGIDNGQDGMPKLILIPVLMHLNTFAIIAIEPHINRAQTKISHFSPLQAMKGCADEEKPILYDMSQRYIGAHLLANDQTKYQFDDWSCGPLVDQFAIQAARLSIGGISPASRFTAEHKHCGMETLTSETTARTLQIRQDQAKNLIPGAKSNFSFGIFVQAQDALAQGTPTKARKSFDHIGVTASVHREVSGQFPKANAQPIKLLRGHDVFELQQKSVDWAILKMPLPMAEQAPVANISLDDGVTTKSLDVGVGLGTNVSF